MDDKEEIEKVKALQFFINPQIYKTVYKSDGPDEGMVAEAVKIGERLKNFGIIKTPEEEKK